MADISRLRTGAPSIADMVTETPLATQAEVYDTVNGGEGDFAKGLRSGFTGMSANSFYSDALRAEVDGDLNEASRLRAAGDALQQEGAAYAPRVRSVADVHGVGDAIDYAQGVVGQGVSSMAPTLATALLLRGRGTSLMSKVPGFVGTGAVGYEQMRGEAAAGQYNDPTLAAQSAERRDEMATLAGAGGAVLEPLVPMGVAGAVMRAPARTVLGGVAKEGLTEAATEASQDALTQYTERQLDPTRQYDAMRGLDAAVAGGLTGGTVAGTATGASNLVAAGANRLANGVEAMGEGVQNLRAGRGGDAGGPIALDGGPDGGPDDGDSGGFLKRLGSVFTPDTQYLDMPLEELSIQDDGTFQALAPEAQQEVRRAAWHARQLADNAEALKNPETVTTLLQAQQEGFRNPDTNRRIISTDVGLAAGEKTVQAAAAVKDFVGESMEWLKTKTAPLIKGAQDLITKRNEQEPAEDSDLFARSLFPFLTPEARASEAVRKVLNPLGETLAAYANKTGGLKAEDLRKLNSPKLRAALDFFGDQAEAALRNIMDVAQVDKKSAAVVERAIFSGLNAERDALDPNGTLAFYMAPQAWAQLQQLGPQKQREFGRLLDDMVANDGDKRFDTKLDVLAQQAFGGDKKRALKALDAFRKQRDEALAEFDAEEQTDEEGVDIGEARNSGINELQEKPVARFRGTTQGAPDATRPYFTGLDDKDLQAHLAEAQKTDPNARVATLHEYAQHFSEDNPEYLLARVRDRVKTELDEDSARDTGAVRERIQELEDTQVQRALELEKATGQLPADMDTLTPAERKEYTRLRKRLEEGKTEDRARLPRLREEMKLLQGDATSALNNMHVILTSRQQEAASDEQLEMYRKLITEAANTRNEDARNAKRSTAISFDLKNGKTMQLSAESMLYKSPLNSASDARRLSAAIASVLARDDVAGLTGGTIDPNTVVRRKDAKTGREAIRWGDLQKDLSERGPVSNKKRNENLEKKEKRDAWRAKREARDTANADSLQKWVDGLNLPEEHVEQAEAVLVAMAKIERQLDNLLSGETPVGSVAEFNRRVAELESKERVALKRVHEIFDKIMPMPEYEDTSHLVDMRYAERGEQAPADAARTEYLQEQIEVLMDRMAFASEVHTNANDEIGPRPKAQTSPGSAEAEAFLERVEAKWKGAGLDETAKKRLEAFKNSVAGKNLEAGTWQGAVVNSIRRQIQWRERELSKLEGDARYYEEDTGRAIGSESRVRVPTTTRLTSIAQAIKNTKSMPAGQAMQLLTALREEYAAAARAESKNRERKIGRGRDVPNPNAKRRLQEAERRLEEYASADPEKALLNKRYELMNARRELAELSKRQDKIIASARERAAQSLAPGEDIQEKIQSVLGSEFFKNNPVARTAEKVFQLEQDVAHIRKMMEVHDANFRKQQLEELEAEIELRSREAFEESSRERQRAERNNITLGPRKNSFIGIKGAAAIGEAPPAALANTLDRPGPFSDDIDPAKEVFEATGWFIGPDGKARREIDPLPIARRAFKAVKNTFTKAIADADENGWVVDVSRIHAELRIGDILKGTQLEKMYPALKDVAFDLRWSDPWDNNRIGAVSYKGGVPTMTVNILPALQEWAASSRGGDAEYLQSVMADDLSDYTLTLIARTFLGTPDVSELIRRAGIESTRTFMHELQHLIQAEEGFAAGGTPATAVIAKYGDTAALMEALRNKDEAAGDEVLRQAFEKMALAHGISEGDPVAAMDIGMSIAHSLYRDLTGEAEAFNVERRLSLTPEKRRKVSPALLDQDTAFINSPSFASMLREARLRLAKQSTMSPKRGRPAKQDTQALINAVKQRVGKTVQVYVDETYEQLGKSSGTYESVLSNGEVVEHIIRIATNAQDPMGVALHESMHAFFAAIGRRPQERQLKADLLEVASSPQVMFQLRKLLDGHPAAIKQIEADKEERLAYMYQFWQNGQLKLTKRGNGIFNWIAGLIRSVTGALSKEEKVEQVLAAFDTGRFAGDSPVHAVLADLRAQTLGDKLEDIAGPVVDGLAAVFTNAGDRLRRTNIPALEELANEFATPPGHEGKNVPFLQRRAQVVGQYLNRYAKLVEGTTAAQRRVALENLQGMKKPSSDLERGLRTLLDDLFKYVQEAGVGNLTKDEKGRDTVEPIKFTEDYFPRVWDKEYIREHQAEFTKTVGAIIGTTEAYNVTQAILNSGGSIELAENEHDLGFNPFMNAVNKRKLDFITKTNAAQFAKFQNSDITDVLTTYIQQAVHRAEYTRQFDVEGRRIGALLAEAQRQGASEKELEMARKAVMAMEGTLGHDFNPRLKELQSAIMTAQNVILLPLALFSSLVDPIGVGLRSGSMTEAWNALKAGMSGIAKAMVRAPADEREEMVKLLGIIDNNNMLDAMGHTYNSMHMSARMKKINNVFFRINGMDVWNRRMRVAAFEAGRRFITRNVGNARYMEELGLRAGDVLTMDDGVLAVTREEISGVLNKRYAKMPKALREKRVLTEAMDIEKRVHAALFKFVDGAVLRPNGAQRPIWGSDPRFQLIFHLKQFTFSFHDTIIKRVANEFKNGNNMPVWMLMSYVPFMLVSDLLRGSLTGTINTSGSLLDMLAHSTARSGIMGTGVFAGDVAGDMAAGRLPGDSLLGPAYDHLKTLVGGVMGTNSAGEVLARSVPGGVLLR